MKKLFTLTLCAMTILNAMAIEKVIICSDTLFAYNENSTSSSPPQVNSMLSRGWTVKHISCAESSTTGGYRHITTVYVLESPQTNAPANIIIIPICTNMSPASVPVPYITK
jgi:hypothetical protein